jgi:molybdate transport system substrate-binding protein
MTWCSLAISSGRSILLPLAASVALLASHGAVHAGELRLLSAASIQEVFKEVLGDFEHASGHRVILQYATMGAITERIRNGEPADLVISSRQSVAALLNEQRIEAGSQTSISKVGVGVIVPSGSPVPVIASVEDFRRVLIAATTIVYADPSRGGAAGIHIARVILGLGLAEQLTAKTVLAAGGDVTEVTLSQGEGAVGMTQISEIVGKPGAVFAGPLPRQLQNYTIFAGGRPVGARHPEIADALLRFLKSPSALAAMKAKGMEVD